MDASGAWIGLEIIKLLVVETEEIKCVFVDKFTIYCYTELMQSVITLLRGLSLWLNVQ